MHSHLFCCLLSWSATFTGEREREMKFKTPIRDEGRSNELEKKREREPKQEKQEKYVPQNVNICVCSE